MLNRIRSQFFEKTKLATFTLTVWKGFKFHFNCNNVFNYKRNEIFRFFFNKLSIYKRVE